MKTRIHISLEVSNLKESISFYEKLFSSKASKIKGDYANFRLDEPGLHLALVSRPEKQKKDGFGHKNDRHYGVELFSEEFLTKWKKSAEKLGLTTRSQTGVVCCYAKANKFWVRDPDGNEWEFWLRLDEADKLIETEAIQNDEKVCCVPQATYC